MYFTLYDQCNYMPLPDVCLLEYIKKIKKKSQLQKFPLHFYNFTPRKKKELKLNGHELK